MEGITNKFNFNRNGNGEGKGERRVLDGVGCPSCKNYFWVEGAHIEKPKYCPYCGVEFTGYKDVSQEEFNKSLPKPLDEGF